MKFVQFVYRYILLHLDRDKDLTCIPVDGLMLSEVNLTNEYLDLDTELFESSDWDNCFNVLKIISLSPLLEVGGDGDYFLSFPTECEDILRDEVGLRRIIGSSEEIRDALLGIATYDNERAEEFKIKVIDFIENLDAN